MSQFLSSFLLTTPNSALTAVSFPDSDPLLTNSVDKGLWFLYYLSLNDKICIDVSVLFLAITIFIHHHKARVQDNGTKLSISSKDLCPGPRFFTKWCKKATSFDQKQKEQFPGWALHPIFFSLCPVCMGKYYIHPKVMLKVQNDPRPS